MLFRSTPEPSVTGDRVSVTICQDSGDRATPWCPNTAVRTYIKGRPPYPPSATCVMHTSPADVPNAENPEPGAQDRRGGVLISVCVETGKIATDKCPIVRLRRFTSNAPTETCPMHGD